MRTDGHTGVGIRKVNEGESGDFSLILSYLKQSDGRGDFVIHATSNKFYSYGLQPLDFLSSIGFSKYSGQCQFHHDRCFYREMASLKRDRDGFENHTQIQQVHHAFKSFAEKIGSLFQLRQNERKILREIGISISGQQVFQSPVEIDISDTDMPLWVEDVKFQRLKDLEKRVDSLQMEIDSLRRFLPLIFGSGNLLENAVLDSLHFIGLKAESTHPGFTVDILAQTNDGTKKFGFEITGINGQIKKDSNKLTQVLEFERIKEHGEKTILVANTYKTTPISERIEFEDFTQPVLDFLGRHPILLMTGWDLFCLVRDILDKERTKEELIDMLFENEGRLEY